MKYAKILDNGKYKQPSFKKIKKFFLTDARFLTGQDLIE